MPNISRQFLKKQEVSPLVQKVTGWQSLLNPKQKAASITKLKSAIEAASPEERERIEGFEDIADAIDAYKDAEREDKEDAWEDIVATVEELSVLEEAEEVPVLPTKPPPRHDRYIRCPLCARMARLTVIVEGPFDTWARDQAYGGRGIIEWGPRETLSKAEHAVITGRAGDIAKS